MLEGYTILQLINTIIIRGNQTLISYTLTFKLTHIYFLFPGSCRYFSELFVPQGSFVSTNCNLSQSEKQCSEAHCLCAGLQLPFSFLSGLFDIFEISEFSGNYFVDNSGKRNTWKIYSKLPSHSVEVLQCQAKLPEISLKYLILNFRTFEGTMANLTDGKMNFNTKLSSAGLIYLHFGRRLLDQVSSF